MTPHFTIRKKVFWGFWWRISSLLSNIKCTWIFFFSRFKSSTNKNHHLIIASSKLWSTFHGCFFWIRLKIVANSPLCSSCVTLYEVTGPSNKNAFHENVNYKFIFFCFSNFISWISFILNFILFNVLFVNTYFLKKV